MGQGEAVQLFSRGSTMPKNEPIFSDAATIQSGQGCRLRREAFADHRYARRRQSLRSVP
jgi:hypothetical protein